MNNRNIDSIIRKIISDLPVSKETSIFRKGLSEIQLQSRFYSPEYQIPLFEKLQKLILKHIPSSDREIWHDRVLSVWRNDGRDY